MERSIFDPAGGETERSGSRNLGPDAANISHMPKAQVDGEVEDDDREEPIKTADEAAQALEKAHAGQDVPDIDALNPDAPEAEGRQSDNDE